MRVVDNFKFLHKLAPIDADVAGPSIAGPPTGKSKSHGKRASERADLAFKTSEEGDEQNPNDRKIGSKALQDVAALV